MQSANPATARAHVVLCSSTRDGGGDASFVPSVLLEAEAARFARCHYFGSATGQTTGLWIRWINDQQQQRQQQQHTTNFGGGG